MVTYSVSEAADKLGISSRAVQKRCKKEEVRKKDNKYLITDLLLKKWNEEINLNLQTSVPTNVPTNHGTQDQNNRPFIEYLQQQPFKPNNKIIEENKALKLEIKLLKAKLSEFDLKDNERIEIFTQTQYLEFEKRLKKYPEQQKVIKENKKIQLELSTKLEIKDVKIEHANESLKYYKESIDFWKSQAEYKDKQSEKFLEMHSKLIESVSNYSKASFIEATVKAKNTDWSKKPK
tara:strand:- start:80 stop:781 length:702 start_codon:yes stop_codon:yes gene_type:complete